MRQAGVLTGCFCRNHRLTGAKVSFKASHQLPSDVKPFPVIFLEGFTVGRAPPLLPSLPQSPFCSWPPAFPVGLRLGIWAPHRMTSGPAMSSLEKWDRIASISTHKQTHHPKFPPAETKKRKVRKRRGGGKNRGIWKMRGKENAFCCLPSPATQGETLFSPPFTAAVPAVGARLAPLWGGHILLAVLGGGGRAGPFANLGGEEETNTHSRTAPEPVLPGRSHKPQSCPGQGPGSLEPCSAIPGSSQTCFPDTTTARAVVPQQGCLISVGP